MNIKKHIPNIITLLNLFSGCVALVFAFQLEFELAFYFVCLGIFLDFFDGFFARLFKVSSPLGLQLDSLADMVTSGVVPGVVMFQLLLKSFGEEKVISVSSWDNSVMILPFLGFIITLGSCYRLANFNIDTRQTDSFIGVPTPANALFILSLPLILQYSNVEFITNALQNYWVLIVISFISAYIMNAEIPLFSLKIKNFTFKKNALQIFFLVVALLFLVLFRYLGVALIIVFYVLLSVVNNMFSKK
ncbi:CDP-alcohol phosphatidyltransferase family protein [Flavobacterium sp.]|uniref:CDP-alcohol phosphatidyltransferase family protein n=1 Tax=Flavobacterium sp. TaxID=239 RepID=UPI00374CB59D